MDDEIPDELWDEINDALYEMERGTADVLIRRGTDAAIAGDVDASERLGLSVVWTQVNKAALDLMKSYSEEIMRGGSSCTKVLESGETIREFVPWLEDATQAARDSLVSLVRETILEGGGLGAKEGPYGYQPGSLADKLSQFFDARKSQASTIARTEMSRIRNDAAIARYVKSGVDRVEYLVGDSPCEICDPYAGNVYALEDAPYLPQHPNCVLPETRCKAPGGVVAGLRAWFDGEIIEVTMSCGARLSITPNHMFLTPDGFAPAYQLCKGDHVFYSPEFEGIISGNPDTDRHPPRIDEVIGALSKSRGMSPVTVPLSPEDLHGDGRHCNGDVDVIGPDRFLGDTGEPSPLKVLPNDPFNPTNPELSGLSCSRPLTLLLQRMAPPPHGSMSRSSIPLSDVGGHSGHTQRPSLSTIPDSSPGINQTPVDSTPIDAEPFGKRLNGLPGIVELTEVINIKRLPYHGYVYDIQTASTLCIHNSIITSNCECGYAPIVTARGEDGLE
jgi:SPP1 gp7 family putative phage head morphogenesis protein